MSEITCPSGMKLKIRGLKGKELALLQDKSSQRNGTVVAKVIAACVEELIDPGLYEFGDKGIDWDRVFVGDRYFAMIAIRAETFGAAFQFPVKCEDCGEKYDWELDLTAIPVKSLDPEDAALVKLGQHLTAHLPSDQTFVKFRIATGKDERAIVAAKREQNAIVAMLSKQIVEIENVTNISSFLNEASLKDLMALRQEMDKRDCGVETTIDVVCPECEHEQAQGLPLGQNFWGLTKA